jgi:hypothetical protein
MFGFWVYVLTNPPPPPFGDILNLMCNFDSFIKTLREKRHFLTNWFSTTCHPQLCFDYTIIFMQKTSTWIGWHFK